MILGGASIIAVGYFIWLFLAPPPAVTTVEKTVYTDIEAGVMKSNMFQLLQEYVKLPIKAGSVGRADPFSDYAPAPAPGAAPSNAPLVNSPQTQ